MGAFIDLTGRKFGRLSVIKQADPKYAKSGQKIYMWLCECDCGNFKALRTADLTSGAIKSCGCLQKERVLEANTKHGMYKARIYKIFCQMRERCNKPKCKNYENYGGRGITVCDEWNGTDGFANFYKWSMEHGYTDKLSIDRIDNNKGYSPDNCRWTDNYTQANNTRKNVNITWNGETHSLSVWGRIKPNGLNYDILRSRLRDGWSIERAFSEPRYENLPDTSGHLITVNGETHNVENWCKRIGIQKSTFYRRIARGWSEERAATQLPRGCAL